VTDPVVVGFIAVIAAVIGLLLLWYLSSDASRHQGPALRRTHVRDVLVEDGNSGLQSRQVGNFPPRASLIPAVPDDGQLGNFSDSRLPPFQHRAQFLPKSSRHF